MAKITKANKTSCIYLWIAILLATPAFFINLGKTPLYSDEPTRALVTLEMMLANNYITPTLAGEYYYNKPPLYNWILSAFINTNGAISELSVRIPAVISLMGFAVTLFLFTARYFGRNNGIISALMLLTCGRILFWDSQLGLIDIFYSWITFGSFAAIINNLLKKNFLRLFLISYGLAAVGFMLKGVPSILFQGLTVVALLAYTGNFKQLFTLRHVAGLLLFIMITGSYALAYSVENSFGQYLNVLWDQSVQRISGSGNGIGEYTLHLLLFIPNTVYHFFPWSLLPLLLFVPKAGREMLYLNRFRKAKEFFANDNNQTEKKVITLLIAIFLANIPPYWLSQATLPRYILMLMPLVFIPGTVALSHLFKKTSTGKTNKVLGLIFITLFTLRILVNIFVIPGRALQIAEARQKTDALEIAEIVGDAPLHIVSKSWIDHVTLFYITDKQKEIITREFSSFEPGSFYLADQKRFDGVVATSPQKPTVIKKSFIRHGNETVYLITF